MRYIVVQRYISGLEQCLATVSCFKLKVFVALLGVAGWSTITVIYIIIIDLSVLVKIFVKNK